MEKVKRMATDNGVPASNTHAAAPIVLMSPPFLAVSEVDRLHSQHFSTVLGELLAASPPGRLADKPQLNA
eukprot:713774-Prymnesium_polylepis.1